MRIAAGLAMLLAIGGAASSGWAVQPAVEQQQPPIVAEARAFMDAYARDLIAGDRPAVAGRYDRRGAHIVIQGEAKFESHSAITAIYSGPYWSALPRFQWHDLMYIPAGPDSVAVAGLFSYQPPKAPEPTFFTYSALLVRQDGELRIRMEHEVEVPKSPTVQSD